MVPEKDARRGEKSGVIEMGDKGEERETLSY